MLGIHISLYDEPDFVDDNHIPFSQYQFAIGIDTGGLELEGDIGQNWYETFPLALASMIVKVVSCECIVVENLQRITATFVT